MTLTYGELFAGIGGMSLGLERAGLSPRWFVEIDDYCRRVLAKHWPDVLRYGDIKELTGHELEPVDLICGGFPCQPVSAAGQKRGASDDQWLWPEFARIIHVVRPKYVLVENVADLRVRGLSSVLGDLAILGFDAEWSVFPACAVGAPFTRPRLFIVAHANGHRCQGPRLSQERRADLSRFAWGDSGSGRQSLPESRHWEDEPRIPRVADGVPARVDRLRALGNAVVPQVAEWIARRIMDAAG